MKRVPRRGYRRMGHGARSETSGLREQRGRREIAHIQREVAEAVYAVARQGHAVVEYCLSLFLGARASRPL